MAFKLSPEALAKTAAKRQSYILSMPEKIADLTSLLREWKQSPENVESLTSIKRAVHRLCGSAGLYHCEALLDAAQKCADYLKRSESFSGTEVSIHLAPVIDAMNALTHTETPRSGEQ